MLNKYNQKKSSAFCYRFCKFELLLTGLVKTTMPYLVLLCWTLVNELNRMLLVYLLINGGYPQCLALRVRVYVTLIPTIIQKISVLWTKMIVIIFVKLLIACELSVGTGWYIWLVAFSDIMNFSLTSYYSVNKESSIFLHCIECH